MTFSEHEAMDTWSDEALVLACRRGEARAWEVLVRRYQRLIYTIPRRAGLDEDQAGEVFQQVFVALFEQLNQIQQPARISAWLTTLARRMAWRLIRRQNTTVPLPDGEDESFSADLADTALLPDEMLLRLERQHALHLAVTLLDERCRMLVSLLFYEPDPPPYSAIAATLGVSEGSIGPTRARCLQKLRRLLEERGF